MSIDGWIEDKDSLCREFKFKTFPEAISFMMAVALQAEKMDHHPEWTNVYNKVSVRLSTHSSGGVTDKDYELARYMNGLARA